MFIRSHIKHGSKLSNTGPIYKSSEKSLYFTGYKNKYLFLLYKFTKQINFYGPLNLVFNEITLKRFKPQVKKLVKILIFSIVVYTEHIYAMERKKGGHCKENTCTYFIFKKTAFLWESLLMFCLTSF